MAEAILPLVFAKTDFLGGLELGGIPIVTVVSSLSSIPALFVRKEAETYGTCRLAEWAGADGRWVVLSEDVITTGGAVRAAALALGERDAQVDMVICAIDGSERGSQLLETLG